MHKDKSHKSKDGSAHNAHGDSSSSLATKEKSQAHNSHVEDKREEAREIHTNGSTPRKNS